MTQKKSDSKGSAHADSGEELRRRAEKKAKADEASIRDTLSPEESRQTLYELRVHQIELEMQNEELRRAQEALEALRARYFDLYDLAPVGYFVLSEQGLILEANLTSATMLGEERGALVKKPIARFIFPEDQDIYYRHRKPLFETGAPQVCELRMARKDGALFWARVEATAAQGTDGGLVCRAAISDITERKRAEEALREAEQQFHTLADAGQALIWTSGPDKKCNYFNLPWLRFTGRTLEQEMNDGWTKGVHPDDFERCLGIYTEAFEQRECFSMDYRLCHRDGQFRWIQDDGTPRYDSQGNFLGYLGHCLDITDRKRAEAAVQASESRYRQLVENAKEAILVAQDGFLKFVNRMASEMTGYSEPELISRPFPEFIHPDDREMVVNQYLKRMAGDTDQPRYVFRLLTRDGAVKW
ncbi:MAG: PAS domain S-box protein, partial [Candidatus Aminicenantes bacterium]|nr:PAS domain S-box protein [Candidatus Aminicenantes bacterium]